MCVASASSNVTRWPRFSSSSAAQRPERRAPTMTMCSGLPGSGVCASRSKIDDAPMLAPIADARSRNSRRVRRNMDVPPFEPAKCRLGFYALPAKRALMPRLDELSELQRRQRFALPEALEAMAAVDVEEIELRLGAH